MFAYLWRLKSSELGPENVFFSQKINLLGRNLQLRIPIRHVLHNPRSFLINFDIKTFSIETLYTEKKNSKLFHLQS